MKLGIVGEQTHGNCSFFGIKRLAMPLNGWRGELVYEDRHHSQNIDLSRHPLNWIHAKDKYREVFCQSFDLPFSFIFLDVSHKPLLRQWLKWLKLNLALQGDKRQEEALILALTLTNVVFQQVSPFFHSGTRIC